MADDKLKTYRRKRDFGTTREPSGDRSTPAARKLRFVIQKHDATRLHYDFRLELDGVFKSWAVTRGPSLDPADKRLAVEVEDHPLDYGDFEGTIPKGQYGGGTVMLWDRGTYGARGSGASRGVSALEEGYAKGKLELTLRGKKLRGGFTLVRTRGGGGGAKPQWLLMKARDAEAEPGSDITAEAPDSVATGRTMAEIAEGAPRRKAARKRAKSPKRSTRA